MDASSTFHCRAGYTTTFRRPRGHAVDGLDIMWTNEVASTAMLAEWSRGVVERLRDDEAFSARVQSEFAKGVRDAMQYDHLDWGRRSTQRRRFAADHADDCFIVRLLGAPDDMGQGSLAALAHV